MRTSVVTDVKQETVFDVTDVAPNMTSKDDIRQNKKNVWPSQPNGLSFFLVIKLVQH